MQKKQRLPLLSPALQMDPLSIHLDKPIAGHASEKLVVVGQRHAPTQHSEPSGNTGAPDTPIP